MRHLVLICFLLLPLSMLAQDKAMHIFLGTPMGLMGDGGKGLKPRVGFAIGLDYWGFNKKGYPWSAGAAWNSFKRSNETQKETFEYLVLHAMPLVWQIGKKKQVYAEAGIFGNYLLHSETILNSNLTNTTKLTQRTYLGLSGGIGVRLGQDGGSHLIIGLRDDLGALGFGKGFPQKFNTITLFAGIEI